MSSWRATLSVSERSEIDWLVLRPSERPTSASRPVVACFCMIVSSCWIFDTALRGADMSE
ncbi:hypothetical protein [Jiella pelagia]|uniref:Uncharacterized protein n=1 Tax=Jiella pelagia TaxID=2986949 RepID=A0ABY7BV69_9HYPH|nr:hypothetical protein [Jiella pelagia]WAP67518.1 hypothetical protein OH818_18645 [Jiella pelagia]